MTALYIIGGIAAFFVLIGLIPVGVDAAYGEAGFALAVRVLFLNIRLGGKKKPKKEKEPKKEEPEEEEKEKSAKKKLPPFPLLKCALSRLFKLLGRLVSSLRTELLKIHYLAGSPDPAEAAASYAAAGMAMDTLLHLGDGKIERPDLLANVDFEREEPAIDFRIRITIRIGRIVHEVFRFGFGLLGDFFRYKAGAL